MRLAILSQNPELYSTRRLVEAGKERGHEVRVIDFMKCYMSIAAHNPRIMYKKKVLDGIDAVVPRIGAAVTYYGTAVLRQFEMMGVYSLNASQAIVRARDKLRSHQILARKGLPMPVTAYAHSTRDTDGVIDMVGGAPLIVKLIEGTQGIGVVLAETPKAAESVIDALRGLKANILVQEFIKESKGADIRCFVIDGRVVAAMMRTAAEGEFRANIHRGGSAEPIKLTPEERSTATRAAKALGLTVAGVDLIRSSHGALVLEVNSSPGLEGIEGATEMNIAGKIIEHIEKGVEGGQRGDRVGH